jgi:hypothetical protein
LWNRDAALASVTSGTRSITASRRLRRCLLTRPAASLRLDDLGALAPDRVLAQSSIFGAKSKNWVSEIQ